MKSIFAAIFLGCFCLVATAQSLFELPATTQSRLSTFENPNGLQGAGAKTNKGGKGNAFEKLLPGQAKTLLDIDGEGTVRRIWLTMQHSAYNLRSIRIRMFWDGAAKPAVDAPFGDFFMQPLATKNRFENAFFSNAEGRSFNCFIPMPFRKHARIEMVNEGSSTVLLFYDVAFNLEKISSTAGYFHCYWSRQNHVELGKDITVLPTINGNGRFLGSSIGLLTDSAYDGTWWGEGEVKMYMDGDSQHPTWVGTGAEDYLGSGWGLGEFVNQYQGCTYASEKERKFAYYRLHIPDAIYFHKSIRVNWQQIGGGDRELVRKLVKNGSRLIPVSVNNDDFVRLLEPGAPKLEAEKFPEGWVNFYRMDDYAVTSYFYLDKPSNNLPALPAVEERVK